MGFDVTAANVIFFVAFLSAGSVALASFWDTSESLEDARRNEAARQREVSHSNLTVTAASYDSGSQLFTVNVKNTGAVVIDLSECAYLLDGAYVAPADVANVTIPGVASTQILLPMETMIVNVTGVASAPAHFKVFASTGASAYWRT